MKAAEHLARAAELIAVAESDDPKRTAYEQAADHILAAMKADPNLKQKEVAEQLGRNRTWVTRLLKWRRERSPENTPFHDAVARKARERYNERKVPTNHKDRVKMATTLLEDRKVVRDAMKESGKAAAQTKRAVSEANAAQRRKAGESAKDGASPFEALAFEVTAKLRSWATDLDAIRDELETVPPGDFAHGQLVQAHKLLWEAVYGNLTALGDAQLGRPHLEVIEGEAK